MALLIAKYAVTAFVIVIVSEIAKRTDKLGALIAALPFVTIMVMIWLYLENQGTEKIANHAYYTFWYVIPTLPMFIAMPIMLRKGMNFWLTLVTSIAITCACFALTAIVSKKFGANLF